MATAAEENRRRRALAAAGHVRGKTYKPPKVQPKGNPTFGRKDKAGQVRGV